MISVRGILSHGGLRKGNPDSQVMTGFYRSPGIAEKYLIFGYQGLYLELAAVILPPFLL